MENSAKRRAMIVDCRKWLRERGRKRDRNEYVHEQIFSSLEQKQRQISLLHHEMMQQFSLPVSISEVTSTLFKLCRSVRKKVNKSHLMRAHEACFEFRCMIKTKPPSIQNNVDFSHGEDFILGFFVKDSIRNRPHSEWWWTFKQWY